MTPKHQVATHQPWQSGLRTNRSHRFSSQPDGDWYAIIPHPHHTFMSISDIRRRLTWNMSFKRYPRTTLNQTRHLHILIPPPQE